MVYNLPIIISIFSIHGLILLKHNYYLISRNKWEISMKYIRLSDISAIHYQEQAYQKLNSNDPSELPCIYFNNMSTIMILVDR